MKSLTQASNPHTPFTVDISVLILHYRSFASNCVHKSPAPLAGESHEDVLLIQLNHLTKKFKLSRQKTLLLVCVVSALAVGSRRGAGKSLSENILVFLLLSQWGCARKTWYPGPA